MDFIKKIKEFEERIFELEKKQVTLPVDISNGWVNPNETWVYVSADDPTYTFKIVGIDLTTKYSAGMRIKLTQATGGVKYFIITKVVFSTDTTITIYGGTDYDLTNETISSPYFSSAKSPFGFPISPDKWTVKVTDTSDRSQASPVTNTWYNLGSISITIPIGVWRTSYQVTLFTSENASGTHMQSTLSTANNSSSDPELQTELGHDAGGASSGITIATLGREKTLVLTSKTVYYLNARTMNATYDTILFKNTRETCVIEAVCGYL